MAEDEEVQREADKILPKLCEKLASQMLYNQRITSTSTYWANRGVRVRKKDIVGETAKAEYVMDLEKYMSVSTMSIRFYIDAKLPLHYLELSIAFFRLHPPGLRTRLTHGGRWLSRGGLREMRSLQPWQTGMRATEAMVEHTARETAAQSATWRSWYVHTWNDLHFYL